MNPNDSKTHANAPEPVRKEFSSCEDWGTVNTYVASVRRKISFLWFPFKPLNNGFYAPQKICHHWLSYASKQVLIPT